MFALLSPVLAFAARLPHTHASSRDIGHGGLWQRSTRLRLTKLERPSYASAISEQYAGLQDPSAATRMSAAGQDTEVTDSPGLLDSLRKRSEQIAAGAGKRYRVRTRKNLNPGCHACARLCTREPLRMRTIVGFTREPAHRWRQLLGS